MCHHSRNQFMFSCRLLSLITICFLRSISITHTILDWKCNMTLKFRHILGMSYLYACLNECQYEPFDRTHVGRQSASHCYNSLLVSFFSISFTHLTRKCTQTTLRCWHEWTSLQAINYSPSNLRSAKQHQCTWVDNACIYSLPFVNIYCV